MRADQGVPREGGSEGGALGVVRAERDAGRVRGRENPLQGVLETRHTVASFRTFSTGNGDPWMT